MTKEIRHHIPDQLLMAYSAGTLPEAFNLMIATHVSLCDSCRAQLGSFDAIGGAVLDDNVADCSLSDDALARTFALIDAADPAPARRTAPPAHSVLPAPLRDYVGGDVDAVRWRSIGMGVRQAILPTSKSASARLLYIPAGSAVPDHGHRGLEMTMVLQGAFSDEVDRFGRGDVEMADEDLEHMPVADIGEDCICLAVTDAPLRFNSWVPRLLQPFLRI